LGVQIHAASHDISKQNVAVTDDADGGFIAARFDTKNYHYY
jgi:hypothetical protein